MRNPLRSEAEAFRFLLAAVVYFGLIAIAGGLGGRWWGLGVFVFVTVAFGWVFVRRGDGAEETPRERVVPPPAPERRVLVLAQPGTRLNGLRDELRRRAGTGELVLVVPALAPALEQVTGDVDDRRAEAQRQADELARRLGGGGTRVRAEVGADDPLQAIEDALRLHGAEAVVIAGGDEALVEHARQRFAVPVERVS